MPWEFARSRGEVSLCVPAGSLNATGSAGFGCGIEFATSGPHRFPQRCPSGRFPGVALVAYRVASVRHAGTCGVISCCHTVVRYWRNRDDVGKVVDVRGDRLRACSGGRGQGPSARCGAVPQRRGALRALVEGAQRDTTHWGEVFPLSTTREAPGGLDGCLAMDRGRPQNAANAPQAVVHGTSAAHNPKWIMRSNQVIVERGRA